jgi:hypothetical protein
LQEGVALRRTAVNKKLRESAIECGLATASRSVLWCLWQKPQAARLATSLSKAMRVVLRTVLEILNASTGKRTPISVAIIALVMIVVLVAVSFRNELTEDEVIGALPILPPAGPTELQPAPPLGASTAAPPAGDVETGMQTSRELVPSPRPRPVDKPRLRQTRNIRDIPDNVLPILLAGSIEVPTVRPPAALMPPVGDAETLVQDPVTFHERLLPPAGPTEIQAVRPLAASTDAPPVGDAEMAMRSSGASRELVRSPTSRRAHKSRPRRAHNMGKRSNSSVATLPAAGPNEIQPVRPLAASTVAQPVGDAETAMRSSGASRELVHSPTSRRAHKPRPRQARNIRIVPNNVGLRDAVAILKDVRDPSQIDRVVKDNPSNVLLLLVAEIRRASQETGRLMEKVIDEIEPPTLPKELTYARASRAQLEAYRLDLEAAEANAMAAMSRYVALLESEREKLEVVVRSLDIDDRYIRAALSGIDKRQAQSTDITSKMLSANAEFYRATGGYVAFLIEQFEHYKVSTNGHFLFSSQSMADRYEAASRQINDAIKRLAELEEERKKLTQVQQEEWERFAWGN